jgi:hypothetical protein
MGDVPAAILDDRDFVVDFARYSEGILDEKFLRRKYRFAESVWESLGEDDALVKLIEDEKLRRIRDGSSKREKAQQHIVRAPDILNAIMSDTNANNRHRVDAIKTLDAIATPPGQAAAADQNRFIIRIDLSADLVGGPGVVETYNKSRAITPDDPDDTSTTPQELVAIAALNKPTDGGNGNAL